MFLGWGIYRFPWHTKSVRFFHLSFNGMNNEITMEDEAEHNGVTYVTTESPLEAGGKVCAGCVGDENMELCCVLPTACIYGDRIWVVKK